MTWVAKKTGLQMKIIKETKNLKIEAEENHDVEKTFLRNKNFISVAKKISWVTWPVRAIVDLTRNLKKVIFLFIFHSKLKIYNNFTTYIV